MARVCEIFCKASEALGVPVLTPEYEIVLALVDFPELTADQLFEQSSLSRAGFFNTIERLKFGDILTSNSGITDRRRRIYRLSGDIRELILFRFKKYRVYYMDHGQADAPSFEFVTKELTAKRNRGLDYFSCEFKILFYLYLKPGLPNFALRSLIDASDTKFHCSLKSLLENGLIAGSEGMGDRRLKVYTVSCLARLAIQKLHLDIFAWIEALKPEFDHPHIRSPSKAPGPEGKLNSEMPKR
jgi:DNA-binding MarR family transcriptional regulator